MKSRAHRADPEAKHESSSRGTGTARHGSERSPEHGEQRETDANDESEDGIQNKADLERGARADSSHDRHVVAPFFLGADATRTSMQ